MIVLLIANIFLAGTFILSKLLLTYIPPLQLAGMRCVGAGILSLFLATFYKRESRARIIISKKILFLLFNTLFFGIFITYFLEFWALQYVSTTKVTLLYNISPFIMVGYSYIFFAEGMTLKKWIGLLIGMAGIIPILISPSPAEETSLVWRHISWQELALVVAMVCEGFSWVCSRKLIREYQYSVFMLNGITLLLGGFLLEIAGLCVEPMPSLHQPLSVFVLSASLIIVALISNNWLTSLFRTLSLSIISFSGLLLPIFTSILGYLFLGETITKDMILSFFIIAVGLYIFYNEEIKVNYIES